MGVAEASALADSALAEVEALDSALTCAPPEQADRVSIIAAESAAIEVRLNIIVSSFLVCGCADKDGYGNGDCWKHTGAHRQG